jgi:UDPglucose 6-dehydrogenase
VGTAGPAALATIRAVYQPQIDAGVPFLATDLPTAELVKGSANAFLAAKISFANAMADICAATGGDIAVLAQALGLDARIGPAFLRAGIGYGGACLPKDVRGLTSFAKSIGAENAVQLLGVVDAVNTARRDQILDLVRGAIDEIAGKRIAIWGAAFKPGTDDVRDSPGLELARTLRKLGAQVTVYDPMATDNALDASPDLGYAESASSAVAGADALVVVTSWPEFAAAEPGDVAAVAASRLVVDACQGIDAARWRQANWRVLSLTAAESSRQEGDDPQVTIAAITAVRAAQSS